ncbi:MAG TPA: beta-ketoacyl-ACP synthase [Gammaproteobacteria bacterium]|nr:beta-ketoacyl-ACP synthase [Gammaproteobacteria bacterium]
MHRVAVTGMSGLTALGHDWPTVRIALHARRSGVSYLPELDGYEGLRTRLGSRVAKYDIPPHYDRKILRSMGPVAVMSALTAERALQDAGLLGHPVLKSGRTGIAHGASAGSADAILAFGKIEMSHKIRGVTSNTYVQMMSHTGAVNIGMLLGITGRVIPSSSACTSGSQAIGYAYETIQQGKQTVMVAGGAEELSVGPIAMFDTMFGASVKNDAPHMTPRPFDRDRDGIVIGEGATTLVLEELEHARARGARIHAELVGFGTNSDGAHMTQPMIETMVQAMQLALDDAGISAEAVGYVNAHGTATDRGDVAEAQATREVFKRPVPISSLKSYLGHTLGACGALESWLSIAMMEEGWFAPTINLDNLDPACEGLDYITGDGRRLQTGYVMNNNFAFGGINTSLIFKRWEER